MVAAVVGLLAATGIAAADDESYGFPHAFCGSVRTYSTPGDPYADAPVGTVVSARVGGLEMASIEVTEAGKYGGPEDPGELKLYVQGDICSDCTVEFYVDGYKAQEVRVQYGYPDGPWEDVDPPWQVGFDNGAVWGLDLIAYVPPGATPTPAPTPPPGPGPGPGPGPTPTPTPGPEETPTPTPTPTPEPEETPTPTPTATPGGNATVTPTPAGNATATPIPGGNVTPTPTPEGGVAWIENGGIVTPDGGGVITEDGRITVEFEPGALPGDTEILIEYIPCGEAPEGFRMGDTCFRVTATVDGEPVTELEDEVEICVEYGDEDLAVAEGDPAQLTIAYYDEDTGEWDILPTELNEAEGTVCITITHLSEFAVLSEEGAGEAGGWQWWYYLLIGLAALAVLLVIIVLLMQRKRKKKKPPQKQRPQKFEPEEMPEPL